MPGWHARTKQLVADGQLLVAGLAPEQHGDRMALFLQWKQMDDMPVMVDSFNILGLKAVPITLLIDESGIIRHRNPAPEDLATFLARPTAEVGSAPKAPRLTYGITGINPLNAHRYFRRIEDIAFDFAAYRQPDWPRSEHYFQLGVAYRKRHDSPARMENDFANAVSYWRAALELDPSNYIWRRRLQQYGPLLDKPYPFYNWVAEARRDITGRGDTPHPLTVEPGDSERAMPAKRPDEAREIPPHPDPDGKLLRDHDSRFQVSSAVIPHTSKPGRVFRVVVEVKPNAFHRAKWNDEGGISTVHLKSPQGWSAQPSSGTLMPVKNKALTAARRLEFELHRNDVPVAENPSVTVEFFGHVCSGAEGVCQFLRRDVIVELP